MDTSHLLSRQRRPQSYRIPIQRIDGRCDRVRASTHRWLDEAPTSKGACLRLTFSTSVYHRLLPPRSGWPDCSILNRRSADILNLAERAQPLHNPDITSFRTS